MKWAMAGPVLCRWRVDMGTEWLQEHRAELTVPPGRIPGSLVAEQRPWLNREVRVAVGPVREEGRVCRGQVLLTLRPHVKFRPGRRREGAGLRLTVGGGVFRRRRRGTRVSLSLWALVPLLLQNMTLSSTLNSPPSNAVNTIISCFLLRS